MKLTCPVAGIGVSGFESSGSAIGEIVNVSTFCYLLSELSTKTQDNDKKSLHLNILF